MLALALTLFIIAAAVVVTLNFRPLYYLDVDLPVSYTHLLVVDKFSDVLVVESLALGIDKMKLRIVELLKKVLAEDGGEIRGVYERSDAKERLKEGMDRVKGFSGPEFDTDVEIVENGVRYIVDVKDGQKTGFFLDQKYNRLAMQRLCRDAEVLDCCLLYTSRCV